MIIHVYFITLQYDTVFYFILNAGKNLNSINSLEVELVLNELPYLTLRILFPTSMSDIRVKTAFRVPGVIILGKFVISRILDIKRIYLLRF